MRSLRALLAVALLVGFFVLAAALIVGLGIACYLAIDLGGDLTPQLAAAAGVTSLAVLRSLVAAVRHREIPEGLPLTRTEQPQLWTLIDELSTAADVRGPDELVLVADDTAAVTDDGRFLGLLPGRRRMFIGVPYLLELSVSELRSVLAHELGHFAGDHTALTRITYRGVVAMAETTERLRGDLTGLLLSGWGALYLLVASDVSRHQELAADALAARLTGTACITRALRRTAAIAALSEAYAEQYLVRAAHARRTPDLAGGFRQLLVDPQRRAELNRLCADPPTEDHNRFDTHPPLPVRLNALAHDHHSETTLRPSPADTLVVDLDALITKLDALLDELPDDTDAPAWPHASWAEVISLTADDEVRRGAARIATELERSRLLPHPTLSDALDLVAAGRAAELPEAPGATTRQWPGATALNHLVGAAALSTGRASYQVSWSRVRELAIDDRLTGLETLIETATTNPTALPALRQRLRDLNIPLDHRPEKLPEPTAVLAVLTEVVLKRRAHDLLVLDNGLLLLRRPALRHAVRQHRRADRLIATPVDDLRARAHARYIPDDEITRIEHDEDAFLSPLRVHYADGRELRLRITNYSRPYGDPDTLALRLGLPD